MIRNDKDQDDEGLKLFNHTIDSIESNQIIVISVA